MKNSMLLAAALFCIATHAPCQSTAEPRELLELRASFEKARTAALSPLEKKYADALTSMRDRLTKKGDLNGALAVQAEITKLLAASAAPRTDEGKLRLSKFNDAGEFTAWLQTTTWTTSAGSVLRFPSADTLVSTKKDGTTTTYNTSIDKIGVVSWKYSTGATEVMTIESDLKSATSSSLGMIERQLSK
jgi:hypothetical protein